MSQFTRPLDIRKVEGTDYWDFLADIVFHVDTYPSEEVVRVKASFRSDLGSIPPQAWSIIGHPLGKGAQAFGVHDWLWQHPSDGLPEGAKPRTRRRCDQILLQGLRILMPGWTRWWKRTTIYTLVRMFGGEVWKKYREKERKARAIAEACKKYREVE